ncbi:ankyrin repeat-containing protein [Heterostelium album PN500]|uniref:NAD(+) ADP-ribosyltransferase n=1 Tax=Heterostelium pallidum (strain ATCC 26659 / Pp 5 / PN500) TaxID=670386 RepID=D3BJS1_HETP5|nr:ankyrin repeat-containing protein [Heterostelium album PN500]EFA78151.1 ankyrin repeat-containing protein [Heterostelium album PN500]|eukprot:XP_020430277.1 ankyrin repeat-containing protein [Heterostelium album PN500]
MTSSVEKKSWMNEIITRRSSTSLPTTPSFMNKPVNKLHQAIALKDLAKVKQRLSQARKAKLELAGFDNMDQTPLCAALRQGSFDIVKDILYFYQTNKMDINQQDKNGYTPLHVAASYCDDQILMLLLHFEGINKGVNVNLQNKNGETPLHKSIFNNSVRLLMVNFLLEAGAEVNVLNSRGESPLHFAVRLGREDLVSVLVKAGADITVKGNEKKTCYELSLQGGNVKVINFLKNVQDVYNWLRSIELEQYWLNFVKEEIFMDLLPDVDEKTLDSLKITFSGHRLKIIKNCRLLKDQVPTTETSGINSMSSNDHTGAKKFSMESLKSNTPNSVSSDHHTVATRGVQEGVSDYGIDSLALHGHLLWRQLGAEAVHGHGVLQSRLALPRDEHQEIRYRMGPFLPVHHADDTRRAVSPQLVAADRAS